MGLGYASRCTSCIPINYGRPEYNTTTLVNHPQPDLSHVYAASNDPREHGPGGKGKPGTVYTLSEAEYKQYFPGPWTKPTRVPFETGGWVIVGDGWVRPTNILVD